MEPTTPKRESASPSLVSFQSSCSFEAGGRLILAHLRKIFISYRHTHSDWVRNTLFPVLSAGGAEITIDYKVFEAGIAVRKQMKESQEQADLHLLVAGSDAL